MPVPLDASCRAIAIGCNEGVTKMLLNDFPEVHGHGKMLRGGMIGTDSAKIIGEIARAFVKGAAAVDIDKTFHLHSTREHRHDGGECAWQSHGRSTAEEVINPSATESVAGRADSVGVVRIT